MDSLAVTDEEVEGLINKLTDALERDVSERAKLAEDNETIRMQLIELKEMIAEQSDALQRLAEHETVTIYDLKSFLGHLDADRPDDVLIGDCLIALRRNMDNNNVTDFKSLPVKAKLGVIRIVNKFDAVPLKSLALQIGLNQASMNVCLKYSGDASYYEDLSESDKIDKDVCAVTLTEWVKQYGDDLHEFMNS